MFDTSLLLDKPYKQQLEHIYSAARFHAPKSRYNVILKQRHFQVNIQLSSSSKPLPQLILLCTLQAFGSFYRHEPPHWTAHEWKAETEHRLCYQPF